MNLKYCLIAIFVMALVTYIPRVIPITIFRKPIQSKYVRTFLDYTPYAVLGALTFPDIFTSTGVFISSLIGTAVALILSYLNRGLVVVAIGAILAAYITQLFL